ncbi:hypothetical protein MRX96_035158 [Rhipicephalus microplus]
MVTLPRVNANHCSLSSSISAARQSPARALPSGDAPEAPSCELREVASQFVCDLIHRAREVAQRQQFRIDEVDEEDEEEDPPPPRRLTDITAGPVKTPPEIQVDLVGSRTPSPEEVVTYIVPEPSTRKKVVGPPRGAVRERWRDQHRCQSGQFPARQAHFRTPVAAAGLPGRESC